MGIAMLVERMNIAFSSLSIALMISLIAGIAAGSNQYMKERRNEPPTFDWIDFVLVSFTSVFVGLMGYFGSALFIDEADVRLLITGLSAAAGWGGLIAVKEMLLDLLRKQLTGKDGKQSRVARGFS